MGFHHGESLINSNKAFKNKMSRGPSFPVIIIEGLTYSFHPEKEGLAQSAPPRTNY
jgi:hypothetical protein